MLRGTQIFLRGTEKYLRGKKKKLRGTSTSHRVGEGTALFARALPPVERDKGATWKDGGQNVQRNEGKRLERHAAAREPHQKLAPLRYTQRGEEEVGEARPSCTAQREVEH